MDELGHQLQCRKLDTQQMNDGLLHVKWNEQKLSTVDSSGAVRFRAGDILDAEADHQLQSVMHMAIGALTHSILGLTSTKTTELVQRTAGPAPPAAATLGCCKVSSQQAAQPTAMPIIPVPAAR